MEQFITGLGIDSSFFVIAALFWVTYWIIRTFFVRPIGEVLESRKRDVESAEALFGEAAAETEAALDTERARMAEARLEARNTRDEYRREAMARRQDVLTEARSEAEQTLTEAGARLSEQVTRESAALETSTRALAGKVAGRLLGNAS